MITRYDFTTEISALGSSIARAYFNLEGVSGYPIEPEIIAEKFFGLQVTPVSQLYSGVGVRSGLDTTQSILFVDERMYMDDDAQYIIRQSIAHEIGHIVYDANRIRSTSARTVQEAYEAHVTMRAESGIEMRANNFAGALLVPRRELLIQASKLLRNGLDGLQITNPDMTMEMVVDALAGSKLSKYFGVSDNVIKWRLENEKFFELIGVTAAMPLSDVDVAAILEACSIEADKASPALSERVKGMIPQELLRRLEVI